MATTPTGEFRIERLGTEGAGLTRIGQGWSVVPGALPGELVRLDPPARPVILQSSPDRVQPSCRHFGDCGGCSLQHLAPAAYAAFKRRIVTDALARAGLGEIEIAAMHSSPPHSRRRATLKAIGTRPNATLGFNAAGDHRIVDLAMCPVLTPGLAALLAPLRTLAHDLIAPGSKGAIVLTETVTGIDMGFRLDRPPDFDRLQALATFSDRHDLARIWADCGGIVPVAERRLPVMRFGADRVNLPPGGFIQPTAAGEAALIDCARSALAGRRRVADLFAGLGTFTLSIAEHAKIHAVEADAAAATALDNTRRSSMMPGLTIERRDLFKRPLTADELDNYDAVIVDPPRAGAMAQAHELARSKIPLIVAVSCAPATFARDAAILHEGGFRIRRLEIVDQFLWSAHVETIAVLERG